MDKLIDELQDGSLSAKQIDDHVDDLAKLIRKDRREQSAKVDRYATEALQQRIKNLDLDVKLHICEQKRDLLEAELTHLKEDHGLPSRYQAK